jgi:hypothetical protein
LKILNKCFWKCWIIFFKYWTNAFENVEWRNSEILKIEIFFTTNVNLRV